MDKKVWITLGIVGVGAAAAYWYFKKKEVKYAMGLIPIPPDRLEQMAMEQPTQPAQPYAGPMSPTWNPQSAQSQPTWMQWAQPSPWMQVLKK